MNEKILLLGCGILKNEVEWLIRKNEWPVETSFLDSSLHCDLDRLSRTLQSELQSALHSGQNATEADTDSRTPRPIIVFYGCCHPGMESILDAAGTFRVDGQNCVEMLLGSEAFEKELTEGAFFLLEEWAVRWEPILTKTFHTNNMSLIREIFQSGGRQYLMAIRTPCSGDFSGAADTAGKMVGLPVRWMTVGLEHLETVLRNAIERKMRELQWTN